MIKTSRRSNTILTKIPHTKHPGINKRFKQARKDAEVNQETFAKALRTSLSVVKQIEAGNTLPNLDIIKTWKRKYQVSYDWILDGSK